MDVGERSLIVMCMDGWTVWKHDLSCTSYKLGVVTVNSRTLLKMMMMIMSCVVIFTQKLLEYLHENKFCVAGKID